jgi:hypothetical protein
MVLVYLYFGDYTEYPTLEERRVSVLKFVVYIVTTGIEKVMFILHAIHAQ